jgi:hypothetical protein
MEEREKMASAAIRNFFMVVSVYRLKKIERWRE